MAVGGERGWGERSVRESEEEKLWMSGGWGDMFCRGGFGGRRKRMVGNLMREEEKVSRKYDSESAGIRFFRTVGAMAYGLWKT